MQLLNLKSNNSNFKTLKFKPGLNIVSGIQLSNEEKKTVNGVGKSLSLKLIHHILGGSFSSQEDKKLKKFLKNYGIFYLKFKHKDKEYIISKDFSEPKYKINNTIVDQREYSKQLTEIFLGTNSKITFRNLFNVFARRYGGTYYTDILFQQGMPVGDYKQKFINLYLLGIDVTLIQESYKLYSELDNLRKAKKVIEGYKISKDINTKDIKDDLKVKKKRKDEFVVAENYNDLTEEIENLTDNLNSIRDEIFNKKEQLKNKKNKLKKSQYIGINTKEIVGIYNEAKFFFDTAVINHLEDAQKFHKELIVSRKMRMTQEIQSLDGEIQSLEHKKILAGKRRDEKLKNLSGKGAFSEYDSLCNQIKNLEIDIVDQEKYQRLLDEFTEDKINFDAEKSGLKRKGHAYLKSISSQVNSIEEKFRFLVKNFYDNRGGSLKVVKTTDAKYFFDIDAHIPRDGAQAIREVKIFCYDILLFLLHKDLLGFVAHDGCIFSEMDPRQKSKIFKVAIQHIEAHQLQYFVNIGETSLNDVLDKNGRMDILTDSEKKMIKDAQILKLYDESPSTWLFGKEFN